MTTVSRTFLVKPEPDVVVDYLKDFAHAEAWDPGTESCTQESPGEIRVGTRWHNVSKIAGNTNFGYLTLAGVDPINATYNTGELPTTGTISTLFSHVKDGTYPAWSDLRIVTNAANETIASGLATQIISDINDGNQLPDFLPYSSSLVLYHSHYASAFCNGSASNGLSGAAENCGDVNGKIFTTGNTLQSRN